MYATFTCHIYDTTLDIYFAEARFYDAANRTWLAMDPIKDGLNWYQYCGSNPTTYWDPLGMKPESKQAKLSGSEINLETAKYLYYWILLQYEMKEGRDTVNAFLRGIMVS